MGITIVDVQPGESLKVQLIGEWVIIQDIDCLPLFHTSDFTKSMVVIYNP